MRGETDILPADFVRWVKRSEPTVHRFGWYSLLASRELQMWGTFAIQARSKLFTQSALMGKIVLIVDYTVSKLDPMRSNEATLIIDDESSAASKRKNGSFYEDSKETNRLANRPNRRAGQLIVFGAFALGKFRFVENW